MIIQHNIMALNSNNRLAGNNTQVAKNLEKLSSGYKINRAGDDAAGLAISEKMRAQITGLSRASQNAQDGVSLVQTAEGQLTEVHSMLNRMVDLATQASNGTYDGTVDRKNLQKEVQALKEEINRIAETSNFNGIKLLDGSLGNGQSSFTAAFAANTTAGTTAFNITGLSAEVKNIKFTVTDNTTEAQSAKFDQATGELQISIARDITNGSAAVTQTDIQTELDKLGMGIGISAAVATGIKAGTFNMAATSFTEVKAAKASLSGSTTGGVAVKVSANTAGTKGNAAFTVANGTTEGVTIDATSGAVALNLISAKNYTSDDINKILRAAGADYTYEFKGKVTGTDLATFDPTLAGGAGIKGGGLSLQIGDTADQRVAVEIGNMGVAALGLSDVDVSDEASATKSMKMITDAINSVSGTRADLGAIQNRLEHTINNLTTTTENMTAAESRIRDTDMAKEMMQFTKNNVLAQAAQAMLAQANQQPQQVLQLLR